MNQKNYRFLVTGSAGFIGAALVIRLLENGESVIGIDNLNSYYSKQLKIDRLKLIDKSKKKSLWKFEEGNLEDVKFLKNIFIKYQPEIIVNLAAQAGVRYSLINPESYINSNLVGFSNLLECCRNFKVCNFIYASSSSVYGGIKEMPFKENQKVDKPVSLYAATKISNELMAHSYSHLFGIPSTGLRFFTVYGPWGRPDMAPMIFTDAIYNRKPLRIFNYGKMKRDFTFIDDIVEGIFRCCYKPANKNDNFISNNNDNYFSNAPHLIFNIGNSEPVELLKFIEILENNIGIKAIKNFEEIQPGDVIATSSNTDRLNEWIGFNPKTSIEDGVKNFVNWYKEYFKIY